MPNPSRHHHHLLHQHPVLHPPVTQWVLHRHLPLPPPPPPPRFPPPPVTQWVLHRHLPLHLLQLLGTLRARHPLHHHRLACRFRQECRSLGACRRLLRRLVGWRSHRVLRCHQCRRRRP